MNDLIAKAELYVLHFLNEKLDNKYVYHNISHTQRVVEKTKEICENVTISDDDKENVIIAAWFHDAGFVKGAENHEEESVSIATNWLKEQNASDDKIASVAKIILATKMDVEPETLLEDIICDADCAHLASKKFFNYVSLLRKEWELTGSKRVSDDEWIKENITFFTQQQKFHTEYALINWSKAKAKNLAKLIKNQKGLKKDLKKFNQKSEALKLKRHRVETPERGVETMFRVALRNHIDLSNIADTKANILLSVNAIIVSLALSNLLPKLDNPSNAHLFIPTIIFVVFTLISIILSILATRPNVTEGKFTKEDVANKKVNLIFFGNFHQMKLEDFEWGISEMMEDRDYLYGSLTKDLYFLGLVLNKKYKILRITYSVFMFGLIISVIAFACSFILKGMA